MPETTRAAGAIAVASRFQETHLCARNFETAQLLLVRGSRIMPRRGFWTVAQTERKENSHIKSFGWEFSVPLGQASGPPYSYIPDFSDQPALLGQLGLSRYAKRELKALQGYGSRGPK